MGLPVVKSKYRSKSFSFTFQLKYWWVNREKFCHLLICILWFLIAWSWQLWLIMTHYNKQYLASYLMYRIYFILICRRYMRIRAKKVKDLDCTWEKGDLRSSRQRDGHSCGLFVLMVNPLPIWKNTWYFMAHLMDEAVSNT